MIILSTKCIINSFLGQFLTPKNKNKKKIVAKSHLSNVSMFENMIVAQKEGETSIKTVKSFKNAENLPMELC